MRYVTASMLNCRISPGNSKSSFPLMRTHNSLLKLIKGTHVRNGIAGLRYMLQCMHAGFMVIDCLSYIKSGG